MERDDFDAKLKAYYSKQKVEDQKNAPSFDEFVPIKRSLPLKLLQPYVKIAATVIILLGIGFLLKKNRPEKETPIGIDKQLSTQILMPKSEYIWNWRSPTESLLTMANQSQKIENNKK
ncbi:MAG: hypothetical protein HKN90_06555 [Flavobacteriaceae bacterium]|nr:hypothetical protein [Flavobacteriaceae bacterium]